MVYKSLNQGHSLANLPIGSITVRRAKFVMVRYAGGVREISGTIVTTSVRPWDRSIDAWLAR